MGPQELRIDNVQQPVLYGQPYEHARYFVLQVTNPPSGRRFVKELAGSGWIAAGSPRRSGRRGAGHSVPAVTLNVAFTFRGLEALELPLPLLRVFEKHARAFTEGAVSRAASRCGDTGPSAAETWDERFRPDRTHILLSLRANRDVDLNARIAALKSMPGMPDGIQGWERPFEGQLLPSAKNQEHFGFRDGISQPRVIGVHPKGRHGTPDVMAVAKGEFVLGYDNEDRCNRWRPPSVPEALSPFFRDGSFAAFRQVQQDVGGFRRFTAELADANVGSAAYYAAKMVGRWPNGAIVKPGVRSMPTNPGQRLNAFDFTEDRTGEGCPFGSHIRRTNPRADPVIPERRRLLMRRGIPYGKEYRDGDSTDRGLLGLFFCASLEDQFEFLMSEWVNKNAQGVHNEGDAKDPLVWNHESLATTFEIPRRRNKPVAQGFSPFVTTRGTLYAFSPE